MEVGIAGGGSISALFLQDDPRIGTVFTNSQISYKVRFEFGVGVVNCRPFAKYMT